MRPVARGVDAVEALEDVRQVLGGDALSDVVDPQPDTESAPLRPEHHELAGRAWVDLPAARAS
ncbi:hypothetical protein Cfla_3212 [Cellulomonas flavigena DSM 20109]|uniref:Uncharacterized protein n=1 Tax=Cellulomonas flavigena (strain ATCC 482 / DSM 20109 / BCRC 11376 / JCM 18109 / NBRC 3775 / NCIMB 8073 / NRS 134) TaxID=446466 RepID=D5ULY8_CELFN|nr:hypothetical protein Cfla_3212 [Cellulomonas flavigena DSM 20109]